MHKSLLPEFVDAEIVLHDEKAHIFIGITVGITKTGEFRAQCRMKQLGPLGGPACGSPFLFPVVARGKKSPPSSGIDPRMPERFRLKHHAQTPCR